MARPRAFCRRAPAWCSRYWERRARFNNSPTVHLYVGYWRVSFCQRKAACGRAGPARRRHRRRQDVYRRGCQDQPGAQGCDTLQDGNHFLVAAFLEQLCALPQMLERRPWGPLPSLQSSSGMLRTTPAHIHPPPPPPPPARRGLQAEIDDLFGGAMPKQEIQAAQFLKARRPAGGLAGCLPKRVVAWACPRRKRSCLACMRPGQDQLLLLLLRLVLFAVAG